MARDFASMIQLPKTSSNASMESIADLPASMLEAFLPGYGIFSKLLLANFGIDISMIVAAAVLIAAIGTAFRYLWSYAYRAFAQVFLSSVYIDSDDDMFDSVLRWLAAQPMCQNARKTKAVTKHGSAWDDLAEDLNGTAEVEAAVNEEGYFSFSRWQARVPPRYEPYTGMKHKFFWQGTLFIVERERKENRGTRIVSWNDSGDDERIAVHCVGRNTAKIRDFLRFIKLWIVERQHHTTTVRHPTPKDKSNRWGAWSKVSTRPSRPMKTVVLDKNTKQTVIDDASEFLHPSAPQWYASRGIPYRRGYLLHGPPGTGKTSLSFALAGIFGLEIYVISLNDLSMNDADLAFLFNRLPTRCIVLLEDIDTAGLVQDRAGPNKESAGAKAAAETLEKQAVAAGEQTAKTDDGDSMTTTKKSNTSEEKTELVNGVHTPVSAVHELTPINADDERVTIKDLGNLLKDVLKELRPAASISSSSSGTKTRGRVQTGNNPDDNNNTKQGISLSGLLNAIDGVATHEGRLLVMTTNHASDLDEALIRPGRVDLNVEFTLASKEQARNLFVRMYEADDDKPNNQAELDKNSPVNGTTNAVKASAAKAPGAKPTHLTTTTESQSVKDVRREELQEMAAQFADALPDGVFSPAEIQGFLLIRKKEPRQAVEDIAAWRDEQLVLKSGKGE